MRFATIVFLYFPVFILRADVIYDEDATYQHVIAVSNGEAVDPVVFNDESVKKWIVEAFSQLPDSAFVSTSEPTSVFPIEEIHKWEMLIEIDGVGGGDVTANR